MPSNRGIWRKVERALGLTPIADAIEDDLKHLYPTLMADLYFGLVCPWCGERTQGNKRGVCIHCGGPPRNWDVRLAVR